MNPLTSGRKPKPIRIPDDIAARCTGPDQAERMDALFRKVIAVPRLAMVKSIFKQEQAHTGKIR